MNNVSMTGRLVREPELRQLPSGMSLCNGVIVLSRSYKDKSDEWQEETAFIDLEAWGNTADAFNRRTKGELVGITGSLKQDKWEDQEGNNRSKILVRVSHVDRLTFEQSGQPAVDANDVTNTDAPAESDGDPDVPF